MLFLNHVHKETIEKDFQDQKKVNEALDLELIQKTNEILLLTEKLQRLMAEKDKEVTMLPIHDEMKLLPTSFDVPQEKTSRRL
jgi:hypothetical protein